MNELYKQLLDVVKYLEDLQSSIYLIENLDTAGKDDAFIRIDACKDILIKLAQRYEFLNKDKTC